MNRKSKIHLRHIISVLFLLTITTFVQGQANPEKHAAGMKRISFLKGTWGGISYKKLKDGTFEKTQTIASNDPDSTKTSTFRPIYNGNYYRVDGKVSFNFSMTIGYDQWRDKYVLVSFEDGPGLIDIYQGNFEANGDLVLSNFEAGTHYVQGGIKYYNRMVFATISDKGFTWYIEGSTDGTNWTRLARYDLLK